VAEIRDVLLITQDPETNPQGFRQELQRHLNRISESLDDIRGHRGDSKFYGDINLQNHKLSFDDTQYLQKNETTAKLQAYDPDTDQMQNVLGLGDVDRLTSTNGTLILTDDGTDATLTTSADSITIPGLVLDPTKYTTATVATHGVLGAFAKGVTYKNTSSTMRIVQISVKLS
jgi:hypothetical protein